MNNSSNSSNGIGFVGLLTVAFIVLKLTNYIDWSWWWVLSPLWITAVLVVFICVIIFFVYRYINRKY
jgi:membrane protein YdbS with pleckstrin-like domain